MVDYQTRYRLRPRGLKLDIPRHSKYSNAHHITRCDDITPYVHSTQDTVENEVTVHSCRTKQLSLMERSERYDVHVLSQGVRDTVETVEKLRRKKSEVEKNPRTSKLLVSSDSSNADLNLSHPNSIAVNSKGVIAVTETLNHRISLFNGYLVLRSVIGKKGNGLCQFDSPSALCFTADNKIAVADAGNRRIQIIKIDNECRPISTKAYNLNSVPLALTCTTVAVEKSKKQALWFVGRIDKPQHCVSVQRLEKDGADLLATEILNIQMPKPYLGPVYATVMNSHLFVVVDGNIIKVDLETYRAIILRMQAVRKGLSIQVEGIQYTENGLIVADGLNNSVYLYKNDGKFLETLVSPQDELGQVHGIVCTPEGHIAATEFHVGGQHAVKVFRYKDCVCHRQGLENSNPTERRKSNRTN